MLVLLWSKFIWETNFSKYYHSEYGNLVIPSCIHVFSSVTQGRVRENRGGEASKRQRRVWNKYWREREREEMMWEAGRPAQQAGDHESRAATTSDRCTAPPARGSPRPNNRGDVHQRPLYFSLNNRLPLIIGIITQYSGWINLLVYRVFKY